MAKDIFMIIRGTLNWPKIVGAPAPYKGNPKYDKGPSWSVDLTPDEKSRAAIKANGFDEKLKAPKEGDFRKESFLKLSILENRSDGSKNDAPRIADVRGEPWGDDKIGNGSVADVKVKVVDYGSSSEKGVYLQAIRILKHVPYDREEFAPLSADDEFFASPEATDDEFEGASVVEAESSDDTGDDEAPY